ncbi:MAG: alpha/beta fold hydrolase, partial [Solirubrobacterales bacterium]
MVKVRGVSPACALVVIAMLLSGSRVLAQTIADEGFVNAGDGVRLYYRILGNGIEPVVLIHGGPGFTSDYLADDLEPMARAHSLFVYDQRG